MRVDLSASLPNSVPEKEKKGRDMPRNKLCKSFVRMWYRAMLLLLRNDSAGKRPGEIKDF